MGNDFDAQNNRQIYLLKREIPKSIPIIKIVSEMTTKKHPFVLKKRFHLADSFFNKYFASMIFS
ncbi:transcriptional regulator [Leuconostoc suionicum]|nr:transcriptional regulator [Leuconostoc suionicum]